MTKKSRGSEWRQSYNPQAVVDACGSQSVLGSGVSGCVNDQQELVADVDSMPETMDTVERALVGNAFTSGSSPSGQGRCKRIWSRTTIRKRYRLRKQTVERVFGIVRQALGFGQFHLRGLTKVDGEGKLVMLAHKLQTPAQPSGRLNPFVAVPSPVSRALNGTRWRARTLAVAEHHRTTAQPATASLTPRRPDCVAGLSERLRDNPSPADC